MLFVILVWEYVANPFQTYVGCRMTGSCSLGFICNSMCSFLGQGSRSLSSFGFIPPGNVTSDRRKCLGKTWTERAREREKEIAGKEGEGEGKMDNEIERLRERLGERTG